MVRARSSNVQIDHQILNQFEQSTSESKKEVLKVNNHNCKYDYLEDELNEND